MQTPADVLEAAADLIDRPGAWVRGAFAIDSDGVAINPTCPEAEAFCPAGAIEHVTYYSGARLLGLDNAAIAELGYTLMEDYGFSEITPWNDRAARDRRQVVRAMRRAARRWRKETA